MFVRKFECPSCGGSLERLSPASTSISCGYCGQTSFVGEESISSVGLKHLLIDYGSAFNVGQKIKLGKKEFTIVGRIRIGYDDLFWDEWYVINLDTAEEAWIQEDDGSFVFFKKEKNIDLFENFIDNVRVGRDENFRGQYESIFVTSKNRATITGSEGELPVHVKPQDIADFVEGLLKGKIISVEILPKESILFVGTPFTLDEVRFL